MEKKRDFKTDFEEYLQNSDHCFITHGDFAWNCTNEFEDLHKSMQWGVYVDFFDSAGYDLEITNHWNAETQKLNEYHFAMYKKKGRTMDNNKSLIYGHHIKTRQEAREQALKQGIEIYEHG